LPKVFLGLPLFDFSLLTAEKPAAIGLLGSLIAPA
jgi:hypothetical protein